MSQHLTGLLTAGAPLTAAMYLWPWDVLGNIWNAFKDFLSFFADPAKVFQEILFGGPVASGPAQLLESVVGTQIVTGDTAQKLWTSAAAAGGGLAGVAAGARAIKLVVAPQEGPGRASVLLTDVVGRLVVTLGLIGLSWAGPIWIFNASAAVGGTMLKGFLDSGISTDPVSGISNFLNTWALGVGWLTQAVAFVLCLYVFAVMVAARLLFLFAVVVGPLVIPLWAYSGKMQVLQWWGRLMLGALMAPIVGGAGVGIVAAFASAANGFLPGLGAFLSLIVLVAGFWFVGGALRELCTSAFDLGAFFVAATAAVVAMVRDAAVMVATAGAGAAAGAAGAATAAEGTSGTTSAAGMTGSGPSGGKGSGGIFSGLFGNNGGSGSSSRPWEQGNTPAFDSWFENTWKQRPQNGPVMGGGGSNGLMSASGDAFWHGGQQAHYGSRGYAGGSGGPMVMGGGGVQEAEGSTTYVTDRVARRVAWADWMNEGGPGFTPSSGGDSSGS
jgi:hypothetical protein